MVRRRQAISSREMRANVRWTPRCHIGIVCLSAFQLACASPAPPLPEKVAQKAEASARPSLRPTTPLPSASGAPAVGPTTTVEVESGLSPESLREAASAFKDLSHAVVITEPNGKVPHEAPGAIHLPKELQAVEAELKREEAELKQDEKEKESLTAPSEMKRPEGSEMKRAEGSGMEGAEGSAMAREDGSEELSPPKETAASGLPSDHDEGEEVVVAEIGREGEAKAVTFSKDKAKEEIVVVETPEIVVGETPEEETEPVGGMSESFEVSNEDLDIWKQAVAKDSSLASLGKPVSVQTQVVAGTNYIFKFANGETVTVFDQPWTETLEVTARTQATNSSTPLSLADPALEPSSSSTSQLEDLPELPATTASPEESSTLAQSISQTMLPPDYALSPVTLTSTESPAGSASLAPSHGSDATTTVGEPTALPTTGAPRPCSTMLPPLTTEPVVHVKESVPTEVLTPTEVAPPTAETAPRISASERLSTSTDAPHLGALGQISEPGHTPGSDTTTSTGASALLSNSTSLVRPKEPKTGMVVLGVCGLAVAFCVLLNRTGDCTMPQVFLGAEARRPKSKQLTQVELDGPFYGTYDIHDDTAGILANEGGIRTGSYAPPTM